MQILFRIGISRNFLETLSAPTQYMILTCYVKMRVLLSFSGHDTVNFPSNLSPTNLCLISCLKIVKEPYNLAEAQC